MFHVERMEDSCVPVKKVLTGHRIYSLLIPSLLLILFIEFFYIMFKYPDSLGSALTIKGPLPHLPKSIL